MENAIASPALTRAGQIELSSWRIQGLKSLVRSEIRSVAVFANKPQRDKENNYTPFGKERGGYDFWIETATPISVDEQRRSKDIGLGKYNFLKWENEPMLIDELIPNPQKEDEL